MPLPLIALVVLFLASLGLQLHSYLRLNEIQQRVTALESRPAPARTSPVTSEAKTTAPASALEQAAPSPGPSEQTASGIRPQAPSAQSPASAAAAILDLELMSPEERKKKDPAWMPGHDDDQPAKVDGDRVYLLSDFPPVNKDGDVEEQYLNILRAFQSRHQVPGGTQERIETARSFLRLKRAARGALGSSIGKSSDVRRIEDEIARELRSPP